MLIAKMIRHLNVSQTFSMFHSEKKHFFSLLFGFSSRHLGTNLSDSWNENTKNSSTSECNSTKHNNGIGSRLRWRVDWRSCCSVRCDIGRRFSCFDSRYSWLLRSSCHARPTNISLKCFIFLSLTERKSNEFRFVVVSLF